jgi:hypothetical protein
VHVQLDVAACLQYLQKLTACLSKHGAQVAVVTERVTVTDVSTIEVLAAGITHLNI